MRRKIDLAAFYAKGYLPDRNRQCDDMAPRPWSAICPVSLDQILRADRNVPEAEFRKVGHDEARFFERASAKGRHFLSFNRGVSGDGTPHRSGVD